MTSMTRSVTSVVKSVTSAILLSMVLMQWMGCAAPPGARREAEQPSKILKDVTFRFVRAFGREGSTRGMLSDPRGISVDQLGRVYVADTGNHRIQTFDTDGRVVGEVGGFGWDPGQFNQPVDVCAQTGMNVYVADSENRRIQRLDRRLNFIETISEFQGRELSRPGALDVSTTGDLFVVDMDNRQVLRIDPFSKEGRAFGGMGYGGGSLVNPSGLAVDGERRVLVADQETGRILEFDSFGNFVASFGEGTLSQPTGCAVDTDGNVFVTDVQVSQIVVFDRRGRFVQRFGTNGSGPGSFDRPMDAVFGPKGRLYVLDSGNNRIQVFEVMKDTEEH